MTCARVMRGISSIANADTPASAIVFSAASLPYGSMIAMTSAPRLYCASSLASGRFTLMMMSASFNASALTVAPTAVNSESGRPDLMPAPGSIATSAPIALILLHGIGRSGDPRLGRIDFLGNGNLHGASPLRGRRAQAN